MASIIKLEELQMNAVNASKSVNHAGWCVEILRGKEGWVAIVGPFDNKSFITSYCQDLQYANPKMEFRVYEALTKKEKK